jgi:acyl-CoA synthetase (AMP-forming)/AMP-acid ligase II
MLLARLRAAWALRPDTIAVSREDVAWTFAELVQRTEALATRLEGEARPLTIAAALPGGPEFTALQFACLAAKRMFAPLPVLATDRERRHMLGLLPSHVVIVLDGNTAARYRDSGARTILFDEVEQGKLMVHRRRDPTPTEDPRLAMASLVQLTSGTTGRPVGVLLSEANLVANLEQSGPHLAELRDRSIFCPLPQSQAMGGAVALEHLCSGSPVHFANRFDPASDLRRMRESGCAGLWTGPHFAHLLTRLGVLRQGAVSLRDITLGTAAVSPELVRDLKRAQPEATIHIRYGVAEASGALTRLSLRPGVELATPGLVGTPIPGVEMKAKGELLARASSCADFCLVDGGSIRSLLDDEGFLATGDLAERRVDGSIQLVGRRALSLNVHGHRIDPTEIENLLRQVSGIGEAVVLGVPHGDDERIVACVEPLPGHTSPDEGELRAACETGISTHKRPNRFVLLEHLPRTAAGKPDRDRLADHVATLAETPQ